MLLYIPASLVRLDYAAVVCFLGLNYLATRAPQMLWGYVLLTLATLPQDTATLAAAERWRMMDYTDQVAHSAMLAIVVIKLLAMVGMAVMHTRVRFSLQFFESDEPAALQGSPAGFARSAAATPQMGTTPSSAAKALDP